MRGRNRAQLTKPGPINSITQSNFDCLEPIDPIGTALIIFDLDGNLEK